MQYTKSHGAIVIHDRIRDLKPMWQRLRMSLSPYFLKVRVLSRAAWPRGLHGVSATHVGPTVFRTLRAGAMRGLEAEGSGCSSWVLLGLVESPEAEDPHFWAVKESMRCTRLCQNEAQISMLCDLAVSDPSCLPSGGPTIALVHCASLTVRRMDNLPRYACQRLMGKVFTFQHLNARVDDSS